MKSRAQKEVELKKGKKFFDESEFLVFADFSKVSTQNLRSLRKAVREIGGDVLVIKKRLLNLVLKKRGMEYDVRQFSGPTATVFSKVGVDKISGPVYKLFSSLEIPEGSPKDLWTKKILGGYDTKQKSAFEASRIVAIGKLPPREVLLAQVLGMLASPIRSFLYVLQEKSKRTK